MANPARGIRESIQASYPGASVIARGRNTITHRAGQQVIIDSTPGPLHVAGTETEIDTAWQPVGGAWQYEMVAADFHAFSRNQLGVGTMYRYLHPASGQYVEFQPLALNWVNDVDSRQQITQPQSVMGVVSDDTITFPGGYGPGRHFAYQAQTARLRKLITIDSLAALPAATVTGTAHLEIEFILSHSAGVTWYVNGAAWDRSTRVITANQIEARDSLGNALWTFDYPRAWDSAGNETVGQMVMRRQGANRYVTVRVPKAWVDAAVYPIYLDPTIDPAVGASADDASEDGDGDVTITDVGLLVGATASTLHRYTMQRFNVTIPTGATIDASYVRWYFPDAGTDDTSCVIAGQDSATPAAGSAGTDTYSISNRTKTTASVTWDADDIVGGAAGYGNSPSLNSIIQELEDSYDYSSGAYMALLTDIYGQAAAHNSTIRSYDGNSAQSPILHIEYTEAAGGVTVTVSAATVTAAGQSLTIVPGAVTVGLNAAALAAAGQAITVEALASGDIIVTLSAAALAAAGQAASVVPGAVTTALGAATVTASGQSLTVLPGEVVIGLSAASMQASPQSMTVVPGAVAVALAAAALLASPHNIGVIIPGTLGAVSIADALVTILRLLDDAVTDVALTDAPVYNLTIDDEVI